MSEKYDLIVIGAGPGGYPAAVRAAQMGKKAAMVEYRELGGTCLNRGCIPTKTLMHTAELFHEFRKSELTGLQINEIGFNLKKMQTRKEEVTESLRDGIAGLLKKQKVAVCEGRGKVAAPGKVEVQKADGTTECLEADKILIATGSRPAMPPIPGADLPDVVNSDQILDKCDNLYKRFVIIGGGVIGMEFATIYQALGCEVTVIEAMDRILPGMDREISQNLKMIMKKRGVDIHSGAKVEKITKGSDGLSVAYTEKDKLKEVSADGVLISVGRRPNTEELFAEDLKPDMNRGMLVVDERFATNIPGVYAIGDVIGGIQLAHMATAEGYAAVAHMFGEKPPRDLRTVPSCVYTNPEIASVGMTADEAKAAGIETKSGKYIMSANGKSVLSLQERGFIKIITEADTGKVIGAQMMCARATDMIGELALAIVKGLTAEDLASVIMPHPTFSEGISEAAEMVH